MGANTMARAARPESTEQGARTGYAVRSRRSGGGIGPSHGTLAARALSQRRERLTTWSIAGPGPISPPTARRCRAPICRRRATPQSDAEERWVGQCWQDLVAVGVDAVSLYDGETLVYGPMSLRPV